MPLLPDRTYCADLLHRSRPLPVRQVKLHTTDTSASASLHEEARNAGLSVSQATIYNTLNQFLSAGLLSEVIVDHARSYFDTNVTEHHHFFIEDEARLIDIPLDEVVLSTLPDAPSGYYPTGVDVVIRLDRR